MLKIRRWIKQVWRRWLRTCLWLPKPAVPICALRPTGDVGMWRLSQVWPVVEYDLLRNSAGSFLQSTEDRAPVVASFLNVLGRWPQMFFLSSFLVVSTLQGVIPPSKLVDSMSVLWMLVQLIFLTTGVPTGCNRAGIVWPFQFHS